MKLISIVVPIYNSEKTLEKCLQSIINQTYKNLEIILVDDGSNDASRDICERYLQKDNRIKLICQTNKGPSAARNAGLKDSTGEYITFIDSDDWVSEEYCEILYNNIINTNSDVSAIKNLLVVQTNSLIKNVTPIKESLQGECIIFEKEDILKEILTQRFLDNYILGKLYKTECIKEVCFRENVVFEDIIYIYDVFSRAQKLVYTDKECYFHLKHAGTISATCSEKNISDYIDSIMYRYNCIKNEYPTLELYNHFALLKEITNACVKYVIANAYYESIEEKLVSVFQILKDFTAKNEFEFIELMDDFQKTSIYLIRYSYKLFFDLLASRHNIKWRRKFGGKDKQKICVVADVPNWAFDSIAQQIKKELSYKYDIKIDYFNRRTEEDFFYEFVERNADCNLVHFLNRRMLLLMNNPTFKQKVELSGRNYEEYISEKRKIFTTSIYDYMNVDEKDIEEYKNIYNKYTKCYYTATKKLFEIYSSIEEFKKPDSMVHDICDKNLFPPINLERFEYEVIKGRKLAIGWVGNSVHSGQEEVDLKGFNTILKPVVDELISEGYNIVGHYADRNEKWRTTEEMPKYYSEVDVCICMSIHEGTPRPVLESMYSGIPIISTDVGIVSEALGEKQKAFIIGDRENGKNDEKIKAALRERIIYLYNNRALFKELSDENMISIEKFDGGKTIKAFENFFEMALKSE